MPTEKQPKPRRPRRKDAGENAATTVSEQALQDTFENEELVADASPADIAAGEHEGANPDANLLIAEMRSMARAADEAEQLELVTGDEFTDEDASVAPAEHDELTAELEASGLEVIDEENPVLEELHANEAAHEAVVEASVAEAGSDEETNTFGEDEGVTFSAEEIEGAEEVEIAPSTDEEVENLEAYYADDGDEGVSSLAEDEPEESSALAAASLAPSDEGEGVAAAVSEAEVLTHQADAAGEAPNFGEHDHGIHEAGEAGAEEDEEGTALPPAFRSLEGSDLMAAVEATFFMHHKPITVAKLRELINPKIDEEEYRTAVSNLMATYFDDSRGIELAEVAGGYQFRTKAIHKDIMRRMYQIAPMKLTNAMLEVLAISAYNQPITRETVDRIRGVDSSHLVRVLLDKKMLRIVGKSDELGRPMLYGTTKEFLEVFGLRDLSALPSLRELEDMLPKNEVGVEISEEDMLAKEMEGIVENAKPLEFNDLEMDELEGNETQKVQSTEDAPAEAHGNGGASRFGSAEGEQEIDGREDFHLPPEITGRLPFGPEGNA